MIEFDDDLRQLFEDSNARFKRLGRGRWSDFFVDGVAFQAGWLGALQPELTAAYLNALAQLHVANDLTDHDRAIRMVDVTRRELLEALAPNPTERKPS